MADAEAAAEKRAAKRRKKAREPNAQEQLAELRHANVEPALKAALSSFQAWLLSTGCSSLEPALMLDPFSKASVIARAAERHKQPISAERESRSSIPCVRPSSQGLVAPQPDALGEDLKKHEDGIVETGIEPELANVADDSDDLDLLALAKMAGIIKPKFTFEGGPAQASNLFNCCIKNKSADEREGMAHENNVLIPGHSSFLIADISNFKLLLKGVDQLWGRHCMFMI